MAVGGHYQLATTFIFLSQVDGCYAFALPSIAIYGLVAGGALTLVLTALFITLCIKKCKCRRQGGGDGNKGKKKTTSSKTSKKNRDLERGLGGKKGGTLKKKDKVTKMKVKDETKGKADKSKKGKGDKNNNKSEKENKNEKNAKKDAKMKNQKDAKNKDKTDKKGLGKGKEDNKTVSKWKDAVSKINTGRKASEVSPAKGSKIAWTGAADSKEKPKWSFFSFKKK